MEKTNEKHLSDTSELLLQTIDLVIEIASLSRVDRLAASRPKRVERFVTPTQRLEQTGPDRVVWVAVGQALVATQGVQKLEPCPRAIQLRYGNRPIQLDDDRWGAGQQRVVELGDLAPVCVFPARRPIVGGRDRSLNLIRPAGRPRRRAASRSASPS